MDPLADVLIDSYYSTAYGWDHPNTGQTLGPLTRYTVKYNGKNVPAWFDGGSAGTGFLVRDTVYVDDNGNRYGPNEVIAKQVEGAPPVYSDAYTISTQAAAQRALAGINRASVSKDKIRAHL